MLDWIRRGLRSGRQYRRLVLVVYLASLLPALLWSLAALPILSGAFGHRPFAEGLLGPQAFQVWMEYAASDHSLLPPLLTLVLPLLGLTWLVQILISAGTMNVLLGSGLERSFFVGMRRFFGRFLRSALAFGLMLIPVLLIFGLGSRAGGKLAEATGNGNLRLGFALGSMVVAFALFLLVDLAYDLSRISAVAQDGRQTFRGYFRALGAVFRRPGQLLGLYLAFVGLVFAAVLAYQLLRGSFAAASALGILAAFLLQQLSMLVRSYLQVSLLGGEVAGYRDLGAADWCRGAYRDENPEAPFVVP